MSLPMHGAMLALVLASAGVVADAAADSGVAFAATPLSLSRRDAASHVRAPARPRGQCSMSTSPAALSGSPARLTRLVADLSQKRVEQAGGDTEDVLRTALADISLADFGAPADGWARCFRSTRIVLKVRPRCNQWSKRDAC